MFHLYHWDGRSHVHFCGISRGSQNQSSSIANRASGSLPLLSCEISGRLLTPESSFSFILCEYRTSLRKVVGEGKSCPGWWLICSWSEIPWPRGKLCFRLSSWAINCSNVEHEILFYCPLPHFFSSFFLFGCSESLSLVS